MRRLAVFVGARLPRDGFLARVGVLAGGGAVGQAIVLAGSPVLTRIYTPEDFGVLAAFASLLALVAAVATLRFEVAIPLPQEDQVAADLLALAVVVALLVCAVVGLALGAFGDEMLRPLGIDGTSAFAWLLPLGGLGVSVYQALMYWSVRTLSFGVIATTRIVQGFGSVGVQILLGLTPLGPTGLVLGLIAGQTAGAGTLLRSAARRHGDLLRGVRPAGLVAAARRYRRFAYVNTPSALVNTLAPVMPPLVLAGLYGVHTAGWYALADRAIGAPLTLISRNVGQVFYAEASRLAASDPVALRRRYLRASLGLLAFAAVPLAVMAAAGPWLMSFVFGADWRPAGAFAQVLTLAFLGQVVASPLASVLLVFERHGTIVAMDVARTVLIACALWLPSSFGASVQTTVGLYSAVMFVMYALTWSVTYAAIQASVRRAPPASG
jgi:O-antigen/teichoic acid export membrane protein